jgi:hypothetical protein
MTASASRAGGPGSRATVGRRPRVRELSRGGERLRVRVGSFGERSGEAQWAEPACAASCVHGGEQLPREVRRRRDGELLRRLGGLGSLRRRRRAAWSGGGGRCRCRRRCRARAGGHAGHCWDGRRWTDRWQGTAVCACRWHDQRRGEQDGGGERRKRSVSKHVSSLTVGRGGDNARCSTLRQITRTSDGGLMRKAGVRPLPFVTWRLRPGSDPCRS